MDAKILKAISDQTRFRLLKQINQKEICACDLIRFVRISQPAVSQHLKVLLKAKLVKMRKEGSKRLYSTTQKGKIVLKDISRW
jgi:ArsR family transcriptional regulator